MSVKYLALFLGLWMTNVYAQGFVEGDRFEMTTHQGQLSVSCFGPDGSANAFYVCREERTSPGLTGRFSARETQQADEVTLYAFRADGSERQKTERYDSETQRSRPFNLLISTLFQRPLLKEGINQINYELTQRGVVVEFGEFEVEVIRSPAKNCESRHITSFGDQLCRNQMMACERYFRETRCY